VLVVADEVQSGLGRTGHVLATRAAGVDADVYLLGEALGGGSCRCPTPTCSACCSRASTAARSVATRSRAPSGGPWSSCWPTRVRTGCSRAAARRRPARAARGARRAGRGGGARGRAVGRHRRRSTAGHRARGQRGAGAARRPGAGHPRFHGPALHAAGDHRGRARLRLRRRRARGSWPSCAEGTPTDPEPVEARGERATRAREPGDSRAGDGRLARGNRATRGRGAASRPVRGAESWGPVALRRG
jgi:hypothetical protein